MSTVGYIRVSRKLLTDPWWTEERPRTKVEAWLDLIFWARFADGVVDHMGQAVVLRRGEFIASLRFLAQRWRWTIKAVRWFLKTCTSKSRLEVAGDVFTRAQQAARVGAQPGAHTAGVYLIVNYDKYNPVQLLRGTPQDTPEGTAKGTKKNKKRSIPLDPNARTDPKETLSDAVAPTTWVAEAVNLYADGIGLVSHGHIGKVLKPAVDRYGWEAVKAWLTSYAKWRPIQRPDGSYPASFAEAEPNARFCSPEDFVKTLAIWRRMCEPFSAVSRG